MTDRVFENARSFEISGGGRSVEVYVYGDDRVDIEVIEEAGWDWQRAKFTMTHEEATAMKNFLIKQGY